MPSRQAHALSIALVALAAMPTSAQPKTDPWVAAEQAFRNPSMPQRRLTGPLFWLHGQDSPARIRQYVSKVAEGGNGSFTVESRPHTDWLGPRWFADLAICLDEAKKRGLQMWIFDEKWWPSGEVGGIVPERYGSKRLVWHDEEVTGPTRYEAAMFQPSRRIGAIAARVTPNGLDPASIRELDRLPGYRVAAGLPAGRWKIVQFGWTPRKSGSRYLVDGASRDAVDWYIRTVYQPHYDHFKADFGKTIRGFFYDEPETHGDWGTEVMQLLRERKVDWRIALLAKAGLLGGATQVPAAYAYQDAYAEAWGRTLYGGLSEWCRQHHVVSMGHFLEHANCYLSPDLCAGNMMQLQKYSGMGGIDAVFDQFVWGKRITRDSPIWQTPKLGSSVSHAYGKPDDIAMLEIFGARGQDLTYPEMKWWTDGMFAAGLNFMIPHSFNVRAPYDTDCPPYFYNGGYEPRWPLYRVYTNYTSRLSSLLTGGQHACPVALLYPGNSAHFGKVITPEQASEVLQDALYDCDWIPYDAFTGMKVEGRALRMRQERYRAMVIPGVECIPYEVMARIRDYFRAGGVVVACGYLPSRSATLGHGDDEIQAMVREVWGAWPTLGPGACTTSPAGGQALLLPAAPTSAQVGRALTEAGVRATLEAQEGDTRNWLHVLHRVKAGRDLFFVANQVHQGEPTRFLFSIEAAGTPEVWDPIRGEIRSTPFTRRGARVLVPLTMAPLESLLIVFNPGARALAARVATGAQASRTLAITGARHPQPPLAPPGSKVGANQALEGSNWIWCAGGQPAAPGACSFRRSVALPVGKVASAQFVGTADNSFRLVVNGKPGGTGDDSGEGWRNPARLDLAKLLQAGPNRIEIEAVNATDRPSPAGLLGTLTVTMAGGKTVVVRTDSSWSAWRGPLRSMPASVGVAEVVAPYGGGPWGRLGQSLTLSPATGAPYTGTCKVERTPSGPVYLEMEGVSPELAARVWVNGRDAGGVIGSPMRLDVGPLLRAGPNSIRIEPFGPTRARLAWY